MIQLEPRDQPATPGEPRKPLKVTSILSITATEAVAGVLYQHTGYREESAGAQDCVDDVVFSEMMYEPVVPPRVRVGTRVRVTVEEVTDADLQE
jgi:hypothetical protein